MTNKTGKEWEPAESCCNAILQGGGGVDRVVEVAALTLPERRNQEGSSTTIFDPTDASVIVACKALYRRGQAKAGGKKGYYKVILITHIGIGSSYHHHHLSELYWDGG